MVTRIICSECGVGNFRMSDAHRAITSDVLNCTTATCENQGLSRSHDIDPHVDTDAETLVWDAGFLAVQTI